MLADGRQILDKSTESNGEVLGAGWEEGRFPGPLLTVLSGLVGAEVG